MMKPTLVPRERLLGRLDRALKCSVCLVSAPAGFGKTTLVAEWAARCPASVAWLSLDEADNDPARFLAYVVAALQRIQIDVGQSTLAMLQAPRLPPLPTLSLPLINEIDDVATDLVLVLVDTGLGLHDYSHPTRKVHFFRFDFGIHDDPDSVAVRQVARLGYAPDAVRHIVMTHLHFDHAGGLPDFPHVQVHCTGVRLRRCGTLAPGSSWLTTGRISRMGRHPRSRRLALPVRRCPAHQCPVRHYAPMAQPSGPWSACPSPAGLGRRPS